MTRMKRPKLNYLDDFRVELVQNMGDDAMICFAARVSTLGEDIPAELESSGLINYLMKNRHGSPFEHGGMTFRIKAPIFVWREYMRHRIGHSYNEQSGRYMELSPDFYIPRRERPLIQVGKVGAYDFIAGSDEDYNVMRAQMEIAYEETWMSYQIMLKQGIAKEVSRMCLPVAVYSTAYVTNNPRSLMSFLSLRTRSAVATYKSTPQWEINQVAIALETIFEQLYPLSYKSFVKNGRVSP